VRRIDLDHSIAELNLSRLHLLTGNFESGWSGLEAMEDAFPSRFLSELFPAHVAWRSRHRRQDYPCLYG
jgi:hypothetical protein